MEHPINHMYTLKLQAYRYNIYWLCITYDLNKTVIYSVGNKKAPMIADKHEKGTK